MKIMIVGGTGNISLPIVRILAEQGHEVVCFNRGKRGTLPANVRLIQGDRANRAEYETTMQREKPDVAIDMVCFTPEDAESNLRAFRGIQQFIQCSSVVTYGLDFRWIPVTEDHPIHPITTYAQNKAKADDIYMEAYYREQFPVTIIKPSTTHGPQQGFLRQIAWEFSWVDRVRKGKPIAICGDGLALHQFLHVEDAAWGFIGAIGKAHTIGQTYNLVDRGYITWADYHHVAMQVIGREVELVGIPLADLIAMNVPNLGICKDIFAYNVVYSAEKIMRHIPEFNPKMSLKAQLEDILPALDKAGKIPNSDEQTWEDTIIEAQRQVREVVLR